MAFPQVAMELSALRREVPQPDEVLRSLFACGMMGAALCTAEGRLVAVNPTFAGMLDYQPQELLGTGYADLTWPQDRADIPQIVGEIQIGKIPLRSTERRYIQRTGSPKWCLESFSLIRSTSGQPKYILALVQDIQKQKDSEEELARLQARLFQAQRMESLGTLAGGIAHDFNNLLGVIMGFASIVRLRLSPADPLHEFVKMIEQSAEHGAELARQLLGLTRREKQGTAPTKVGDVVGRVVKIITRTFDRRIQIQTRSGSGPLWVDANPGQLEQAILNICINARDAMPGGGILSLETSRATLPEGDSARCSRCPPGEYARITVRDTGVGIAPHELGQIFDPFFTTKEAGGGSGLGLPMVYAMASRAGGFVDVQSEVGRGSTFSIHLPVKPPPVEAPVAVRVSKLETGTGTVLVVDDEPMVLAFVQEGLKKLGYKVLTAVDGRQACEVFSSHSKHVDIVFLDIVMQGITGIETCRRLRAISPNVKIILSSGYSSAEIGREARLAGAVSFIDKPYSLEELSRVLRRTGQLEATSNRDDSDARPVPAWAGD